MGCLSLVSVVFFNCNRSSHIWYLFMCQFRQFIVQCRPSSFSVVIQLPFILSQVVVRALSCPELFSTPFLAASAISVYCSVVRVRRIECLPIFSSRQNTPLRTESGVACRGLYHARVTHAQSIQYMIQGGFSRKGCELHDKALQFDRPDWEVLLLPLYFVWKRLSLRNLP